LKVYDNNGMEWNGMEWNGMEWNGMKWNEMESNRIEWSVKTQYILYIQGNMY